MTGLGWFGILPLAPPGATTLFDPFLFDTLGFANVAGAISPANVSRAGRALDELDIWRRVAPAITSSPGSGWRETSDEVARYVCQISPGHVQVGPVSAWPEAIARLLDAPGLVSVMDQVFPAGHYIDHVSLVLAKQGSSGVELHGGAFEDDPRQYYNARNGAWSVGMSIFAIALVPSSARMGGTAVLAGSHKSVIAPVSELPTPHEFHGHPWISGVDMEPGDIMVLPEVLMHGAFPWLHAWERRCILIKAYPSHLANLGAVPRPSTGRFWV